MLLKINNIFNSSIFTNQFNLHENINIDLINSITQEPILNEEPPLYINSLCLIDNEEVQSIIKSHKDSKTGKLNYLNAHTQLHKHLTSIIKNKTNIDSNYINFIFKFLKGSFTKNYQVIAFFSSSVKAYSRIPTDLEQELQELIIKKFFETTVNVYINYYSDNNLLTFSNSKIDMLNGRQILKLSQFQHLKKSKNYIDYLTPVISYNPSDQTIKFKLQAQTVDKKNKNVDNRIYGNRPYINTTDTKSLARSTLYLEEYILNFLNNILNHLDIPYKNNFFTPQYLYQTKYFDIQKPITELMVLYNSEDFTNNPHLDMFIPKIKESLQDLNTTIHPIDYKNKKLSDFFDFDKPILFFQNDKFIDHRIYITKHNGETVQYKEHKNSFSLANFLYYKYIETENDVSAFFNRLSQFDIYTQILVYNFFLITFGNKKIINDISSFFNKPTKNIKPLITQGICISRIKYTKPIIFEEGECEKEKEKKIKRYNAGINNNKNQLITCLNQLLLKDISFFSKNFYTPKPTHSIYTENHLIHNIQECKPLNIEVFAKKPTKINRNDSYMQHTLFEATEDKEKHHYVIKKSQYNDTNKTNLEPDFISTIRQELDKNKYHHAIVIDNKYLLLIHDDSIKTIHSVNRKPLFNIIKKLYHQEQKIKQDSKGKRKTIGLRINSYNEKNLFFPYLLPSIKKIVVEEEHKHLLSQKGLQNILIEQKNNQATLFYYHSEYGMNQTISKSNLLQKIDFFEFKDKSLTAVEQSIVMGLLPYYLNFITHDLILKSRTAKTPIILKINNLFSGE